MSNEPEDFIDTSWLSDCCGEPAWGEVAHEKFGNDEYHIGVCSKCREHAGFHREGEEE